MGAIGLWVPPASCKVEGAEARSSAGSSVWKISVVLPAVPVARIDSNGTVSLDFSNASQRDQFVDKSVVPVVQKQLKKSSGSKVNSNDINDTSFLKNADERLAKPFLVGFNASAITVYWVAMCVVLLAFVLSLFFKTPPLRAKSALQEAADDEAMLATEAATETGSLALPDEEAEPGLVPVVSGSVAGTSASIEADGGTAASRAERSAEHGRHARPAAADAGQKPDHHGRHIAGPGEVATP